MRTRRIAAKMGLSFSRTRLEDDLLFLRVEDGHLVLAVREDAHVQRGLHADGDVDGAVGLLAALDAVEEVRPELGRCRPRPSRGSAISFAPLPTGTMRMPLPRMLDVAELDQAVGAAEDRVDAGEVRQRVHQHHARPAGVVGDDVALVGHLAVVLEGAAAAEDPLGKVRAPAGRRRA